MHKPKRAVLVIEDVAGKRIRRFYLSEPYPKSREIYLTVEFDDETELLIEVECLPSFGITHLAIDSSGELAPVKRSRRGSIRSLVKGVR
ncbi:hypothetical protein [Granulicella paludicola]|uniref:hypothetical protein n=1 Tax=Granulicella paludicola TaxID=474951 RepID=UPI0021DFC407|nr:hypothetical protein [Granulicella paludicola]